MAVRDEVTRVDRERAPPRRPPAPVGLDAPDRVAGARGKVRHVMGAERLRRAARARREHQHDRPANNSALVDRTFSHRTATARRATPCRARCAAARRCGGRGAAACTARAASAAQAMQLVRVEVVGRFDVGGDDLAPLVRRRADDGGVDHRRMRAQDVLDLARVHVVAAADDQLLRPSDDAEVAVGVELADVAGAEPAVGGERLGVGVGPVEVAGEHVRAPHLDLVRCLRRAAPRRRAAGSPTVPGRRSPSYGFDTSITRLGHAVALEHRWPARSAMRRAGPRRAAPSPTRTGGAARADRRPGASTSRAYIVGTPKNIVASSAAGGEHPFRVEPRLRGPPTRRRAACRAARRRARACGTAAGRGSAGRRTSSATRSRSASALASRLPCESTAPFGRAGRPGRERQQGRVVRRRRRRASGAGPSGRSTSTPVTMVPAAHLRGSIRASRPTRRTPPRGAAAARSASTSRFE